MIIEEKEIPKDESLNSTYNGTDKWNNSATVIKLTVQNGGALITDELPGRGIVKQRIAEQEKKIQCFNPKSNSLNSVSRTPSSCEISSSSQSSAEENEVTHKVKPNKPKSPITVLSRSNTGASLFSNVSRDENPKIFRFDVEERLVILSNKHPFLEKINSERKKIPQSYRNAIRIDNLTDNEMDDLAKSYVKKVIAIGKPNCRAC
ncbi:MAG: hypothetical protein E6K54_04430 [Gammaproteobacteria bacterium]|nr:MAG: hypothetical protein E6K54_04430 [Gammaproteobacteria bacterium]